MHTIRAVAFSLLASVASAQHFGGIHAGSVGRFAPGFGHDFGLRSGRLNFIGNRFGFGREFGINRGFGRDFLWPYLPVYPFVEDYGLPTAFAVDEKPGPPSYGAEIAQPPPPVMPGHPLMHEYTWSAQDPNGGTARTPENAIFRIALKDGTQRSAVTVWIEDGNLHLLDTDDRHAVLSAAVIDRDATLRLNRERNLHIQLPPG